MRKKSLPPAPTWIDADAKKEYHRAAAALEEIGIELQPVDCALLAVYAQAWSDVGRLTVEIRAEGYTVTGYRKSEVKNPKLSILNATIERLMASAAKLGLSPAARKHLKPVAPIPDNPVTRFMRKGMN